MSQSVHRLTSSRYDKCRHFIIGKTIEERPPSVGIFCKLLRYFNWHILVPNQKEVSEILAMQIMQ